MQNLKEEQRLFERVVYTDHLLQRDVALETHMEVFKKDSFDCYENNMIFALWCGWCLAKGHPMPLPHNGYPEDIVYVESKNSLSSHEFTSKNFVFTDLNLEKQTAIILKNRYGMKGEVTFDTLLPWLNNAKNYQRVKYSQGMKKINI